MTVAKAIRLDLEAHTQWGQPDADADAAAELRWGGDEIPPDYGVPVFEIDLRSIPVEDGGSKPWLV
jgi:hypothetical protein